MTHIHPIFIGEKHDISLKTLHQAGFETARQAATLTNLRALTIVPCPSLGEMNQVTLFSRYRTRHFSTVGRRSRTLPLGLSYSHNTVSLQVTRIYSICDQSIMYYRSFTLFIFANIWTKVGDQVIQIYCWEEIVHRLYFGSIARAQVCVIMHTNGDLFNVT